jgi:hypothetical protein
MITTKASKLQMEYSTQESSGSGRGLAPALPKQFKQSGGKPAFLTLRFI